MAGSHFISCGQMNIAALLHIRHTRLQPCDLQWDYRKFFQSLLLLASERFGSISADSRCNVNDFRSKIFLSQTVNLFLRKKSGIEWHFLLMISNEKGWHYLSSCITIAMNYWGYGGVVCSCFIAVLSSIDVLQLCSVYKGVFLLWGWKAHPSHFSLFLFYSHALSIYLSLSSSITLLQGCA